MFDFSAAAVFPLFLEEQFLLFRLLVFTSRTSLKEVDIWISLWLLLHWVSISTSMPHFCSSSSIDVVEGSFRWAQGRRQERRRSNGIRAIILAETTFLWRPFNFAAAAVYTEKRTFNSSWFCCSGSRSTLWRLWHQSFYMRTANSVTSEIDRGLFGKQFWHSADLSVIEAAFAVIHQKGPLSTHCCSCIFFLIFWVPLFRHNFAFPPCWPLCIKALVVNERTLFFTVMSSRRCLSKRGPKCPTPPPLFCHSYSVLIAMDKKVVRFHTAAGRNNACFYPEEKSGIFIFPWSLSTLAADFVFFLGLFWSSRVIIRCAQRYAAAATDADATAVKLSIFCCCCQKKKRKQLF